MDQTLVTRKKLRSAEKREAKARDERCQGGMVVCKDVAMRKGGM